MMELVGVGGLLPELVVAEDEERSGREGCRAGVGARGFEEVGGDEAGGLLHPVPHERLGTDDEGGGGGVEGVGGGDDGEALERLAQPHVVAQDPVQPEAPEEPQPTHALRNQSLVLWEGRVAEEPPLGKGGG